MKIPTELKIGAHLVQVVIKELPESGYDGEWDSKKLTITLDKSLPESQQGATLFHEILHAMNSTLGGDKMSHLFLDGLAEQLYQVLSDNKLLA